MAGDNSSFKIDLTSTPDLNFGRMVFYRMKNRDGFLPEIAVDAGDPGRPYLKLAVKEGVYQGPLGDENDFNDRCELRERQGSEQALGTAVYYGFSIRIDPGFPTVPHRCVVAQIKMPYGGSADASPAFSLRIDSGRYVATVEQLFRPEDRAAGGLVPRKPGATCANGSTLAEDHSESTAQLQIRAVLATDSSGLPDHLDRSNFVFCTKGMTIEKFGTLPGDPGEWHDFIVFIGILGKLDGRGEIALYHEGELLAKATGNFGAPHDARNIQYFKIGIYRDDDDRTWGDTTACIHVRDIRRGARLDEVWLEWQKPTV